MNNNYNYNNGQFGGWGSPMPPYYPNWYGTPQGNPDYFKQQQEKKNDIKIVKTIGMLCGASIIAYFVISLLLGFIVAGISLVDSRIDVLYGEGMESWAFSNFVTAICVGLPFGISYIIMKSKKITGVIPLGTTYNKKASACLVAMTLPMILISTITINFISLIFQSVMGLDFSAGMSDMVINGVGDFILMTLFVAVAPAILEEIAIRGILLQPLRRYGDAFAIVSSAVVFSLLHGNMVQIPYTVVAGIFFGYVAVATGSIWSSIILHFLNNFYSVVVITFDSNLSTSTSSVLVFVMLTLMAIVGVIAFVIYKRMNYKVQLAKGVKTLNRKEKTKALFMNVPMIIAIIMLVFSTMTSISEA